MWFSFDGVRSDQAYPYLKVLDIKRSILPAISDRLVKVPGRAGAYDLGREVDTLTFDVEVLIEAEDIYDLRNKVRELARWLDTEETKEIVFSEEDGSATPDGAPRKYRGRLTDKSDLEEIIRYGRGVLRFLCPDPYAEGRTQSATLGGVGRSVDSTSDWNTGTLTDVTGDAGDLVLEKQGTDLSGSIQSPMDFDGMMDAGSQNVTVGQGGVELSVSGTDFAVKENQVSHFNEPGDTRTNVKDDGGLVIQLPDWVLNYEFSSLLKTILDGYYAVNDVVNHPEGVYIKDTSRDNQLILYEGDHEEALASYVIENGGTHLFCQKCDGQMGYILSNGSKLYSVMLPSTGGEFAWFWFVFDWNSASLYKNGELVGTYTPTSSSAYFPSWRWWTSKSTTGWGILKRDLFLPQKLTPEEVFTASYVSSEYDLSAVGMRGSSLIKYSGEVLPQAFRGHTLKVSTTVYEAGTPESSWVWTEAASGGAIPNLPADLTGKRLRYKVELATKDPGESPKFLSCELNVSAGYAESGTYETKPIDLSSVVAARGPAPLIVGHTAPSGTTLSVQAGLSDNPAGPFSFQPIQPGEPIPLTTGESLSGQWLKLKLDLSRDPNVHATPRVQAIHYTVPSAYKPSGMRETAGVDLSQVGTVKNSHIEWQETVPSDASSIVVETQLVPPGESLSPTGWKTATNGGPIPDIVPGLNPTGYTLYVREKLATSNVGETPRIHRLNWNVSPEFLNEGSAPSFAVFTATFAASADSFKLLHVESGKYVLVSRSFKAGDVLVIDTYRGVVKLNGANIMRDVSVSSDFFPLSAGENHFIVTPNEGVTVQVAWTERWK